MGFVMTRRRTKCMAITKAGRPCPIDSEGNIYCHVHDPALVCGVPKADGTPCGVATAGRGPCNYHLNRSPKYRKGKGKGRKPRRTRNQPESTRNQPESTRAAVLELVVPEVGQVWSKDGHRYLLSDFTVTKNVVLTFSDSFKVITARHLKEAYTLEQDVT